MSSTPPKLQTCSYLLISQAPWPDVWQVYRLQGQRPHGLCQCPRRKGASHLPEPKTSHRRQVSHILLFAMIRPIPSPHYCWNRLRDHRSCHFRRHFARFQDRYCESRPQARVGCSGHCKHRKLSNTSTHQRWPRRPFPQYGELHCNSVRIDVGRFKLTLLTLSSYTERTPRPANPILRPAYQGSNPVADIFSMWALRTTVKYLPRIAKDSTDDEARSQMLYVFF